MDLFLVESLLDEYVAQHKLDVASRLPPLPQLARDLRWREYDIARALECGVRRKQYTRDDSGWAVGPAHRNTARTYSFSRSAVTHGNRLATHVILAAKRSTISDESHPFYVSEQEAITTLGLNAGADLIVIHRCRIVNDEPGALQRAYLDPSRFPPGFLESHDFAAESLIEIYEKEGYNVFSRDTALKARCLNQYESGLLELRYKVQHHDSPVLEAEQCLYAEDRAGQRFVLEYLRSTYLENWTYEIPNRPA